VIAVKNEHAHAAPPPLFQMDGQKREKLKKQCCMSLTENYNDGNDLFT